MKVKFSRYFHFKNKNLKMLNAANMYPWYRDSMSQLGQFCAGSNLSSAAATIKTENGYNDCMLALDYAHNKVRFNALLLFNRFQVF